IFLNNLFQNERLNNKIDNKFLEFENRNQRNTQQIIDNYSNSKVPNLVKDYLNQNLSYLVQQEIKNYVPVYLANNEQMQSIMNAHKNQLEARLSIVVNDCVKNIVND